MRLLLIQLGCALAMTGIIWFVQVVHYPLFASAGRPSFAAYVAEHARRTSWVVAPLMCTELGAALLYLLPRFRPEAIARGEAFVAFALVVILWISTGLVQVPLHNRLAAGWDAEIASKLVATNWIRTVAWTLRSVLLLLWTARCMR